MHCTFPLECGIVTGLRERKKIECRLAIQRAALELAVEHDGMHDVPVEAISEHAGISPRTFFNYFPTKESAIFNAYIGRADDLVQAITEWPADDPIGDDPGRIIAEVLLQSVLTLDAETNRLLHITLGKNPDLLGLSTGNVLATNRLLAQAAADRIGATDIPTRRRLGQLTAALSAVIRMTMGFHSHHDLPTDDLDSALREATDAVLVGLGTLPGQKPD